MIEGLPIPVAKGVKKEANWGKKVLEDKIALFHLTRKENKEKHEVVSCHGDKDKKDGE